MTEYLTENQTRFFIVNLIISIISIMIGFVLIIIWVVISMTDENVTMLQQQLIYWFCLGSIIILGLNSFVLQVWLIINKVKRK